MANLSQSPKDNSVRGKGEAVLQTICAAKPRETGYVIETISIKVKRPDEKHVEPYEFWRT